METDTSARRKLVGIDRFLILFGVVALICSIAFDVVYKYTSHKNRLIPHECYSIDNWNRIHEDGTVESVVLPTTSNTPKGETIRFESVLPDDIEDGMWLNTVNFRDQVILIDGVERDSFIRERDVDIIGGISKRVALYTRLSSEDCGKKIEIIRSGEGLSNGGLWKVYYGSGFGIVANYMQSQETYYILVVFLLALSLLFVAVALVAVFVFKKRVPFLAFSIGMAIVASWLMFINEIYQYVFDNYFIDGTMGYLMTLLMPAPFLMYIDMLQENRYHKVFRILIAVSYANLAVFEFLHFTGIRSFALTLNYLDGVIGVLTAVALGFIVYDVIKGNMRGHWILGIATALFLTFSAVEIVLLNIVTTDRSAGLGIMIGCYILLIGAAIEQIYDLVLMRRRHDDAIRAAKQKNEFMSSMSHEIRTPINAMLSMNELIIRESKDEDAVEHAKRALKAGKELLTFVDEILSNAMQDRGVEIESSAEKAFVAEPDNINTTNYPKYEAPKAGVLIVDDNETNRMIAYELLEDTKCNRVMAGGGAEALEISMREKFDLIFMDHMMPQPDGIEALHAIKSDPTNPNFRTPIVVLTANAIAGSRDRYLAEGFDDYLSKPVSIVTLEETLYKFLPKEKIIIGVDAAENGTASADTVTRNLSDLPNVDSFNYEEALARMGFSRKTLEMILKEIIYESDKKIPLLSELLEKKDYSNYAIETHALKSVAASVCAMELSERAKKHEMAAKGGRTTEIAEDFEGLMEEYKMFIEDIHLALGDELDDALESSNLLTDTSGAKPILDRTIKAADDFDFDSIEKCMDEIEGYKWEGKAKQYVDEMIQALHEFDYDAISSAAESLKDII